MSWFKKKSEKTEKAESNDSEESDSGEEKKSAISANVEIEITKIQSSLEALNEVRKANAEQFTRVSEQIGELRAALMDSNKAISVIEIASTKAIDLVNSVQPDKLMIEVRKVDGKIEALRANIEANESMMKDILKEMKEMRGQMNFYKGADQVIKLNNEVKQELVDIKKTEGTVSKHADRVETVFIEVEKKFTDFEKFNQVVKELDVQMRKMSSDFDKMRVMVDEKAEKKEFVKLVDKFSEFEKHTSNILKLLDQKSKNTVYELNDLFKQLKQQLEKKYDKKLDVKGLGEEGVQAQSADGSKTSTSAEQKDSAKSDGSNETAEGKHDGGNESKDREETKDGESKAGESKDADKKKGLFGMFKK
jgi:hypothetical protein